MPLLVQSTLHCTSFSQPSLSRSPLSGERMPLSRWVEVRKVKTVMGEQT